MTVKNSRNASVSRVFFYAFAALVIMGVSMAESFGYALPYKKQLFGATSEDAAEKVAQIVPTVTASVLQVTTIIPTPTSLILTVTPTSVPTKTTTPTPTPTPKKTTTPTPTKTTAPTPTAKPTSSPTSTPTATPTVDYSKPWTVAPNCPQTTQKCVPCTSGTYCRFEPNKTHGFLGWACQNNNPGNIRNASTNMSTDFKNKLIVKYGGTAACGVRYDKRGGSYFVFATYSAGYGALQAYIKAINNGEHSSYAGTGWKCGNCTLTQFFSKYAPGDSIYASTVAAEIGEPTTQLLSYVVTNKLNAFTDAIKKREGFFVQ